MSEEGTSNDELSSADSLENLQMNGADHNHIGRQKREQLCANFEFNGENILINIPTNFIDANDDQTRNSNVAEVENNNSNLPISIINGQNYHKIVFLDEDAKIADRPVSQMTNFNHDDGECTQRMTALIEEITELRTREATIIQQMDVLKKIIEELQTQPHLFSSTYNDGVEDASSCSSRSDRSLTNHFGTLQLKYAMDVFAENNRLLRDRESSNQHRNDIVRMMQAQIDELEKNLKDAETKCQRLMDEWSSKESDFNQRIDSLEKDLNAKKDLLETFIAQNNALGEEYNDLLKQKSNWQSKIDELKSIRRTQQEYDDEIEGLRIEIEKLRMQLKVSADKYNDLNCDLTNAKSNLANKTEELNHLRQILNEKTKQNHKEEYENMKQNFDQLVEESSRLRLENEKMLSKLETMNEMERAFDAQNLGLSALKKTLESKDETAKELRRRCDDLEHILDENLHEKEQKCALILRIQEKFDQKSNEYEKLQKDFEAWKANANAQYDDTCRTYDEKIKDLRSILHKYTEYPGKGDDAVNNALELNSVCRSVTVECDLDKTEICELTRTIETLNRQLQETENKHQNSIKVLESTNADRHRETCETYEKRLNEMKNNLKNLNVSSSKYAEDSLIVERKRNAELNSFIVQKNVECDSLKEEIVQMSQIIRTLTRRCEQSDQLHEQARKTIEALRAEYDEECQQSKMFMEQIVKLNEEVEYLRREKINVVNEADLSSFGMKIIADRMQAVKVLNEDSNLDISLGSTSATMIDMAHDVQTLREELSKVLRDKQNWKLRYGRVENQRRSLIGQKKYLINIIQNFHRTETEALAFMSSNGYIATSMKTKPAPTVRSKFRAGVYAVLATIRIRKKYEKMRNRLLFLNSPMYDNFSPL